MLSGVDVLGTIIAILIFIVVIVDVRNFKKGKHERMELLRGLSDAADKIDVELERVKLWNEVQKIEAEKRDKNAASLDE